MPRPLGRVSSLLSRISPRSGKSWSRDDPLPVYNGPMHDYRMGEGTAREPGPFPVRRTRLDGFLDDFFLQSELPDPDRRRPGWQQGCQAINLDVRQRIAELDLDGMPHLSSGITWERDGRTLLATPASVQGRGHGHRSGHLGDGGEDTHPGPRLLCPQPRKQPLRLGGRLSRDPTRMPCM
jgi:hypothetical protein